MVVAIRYITFGQFCAIAAIVLFSFVIQRMEDNKSGSKMSGEEMMEEKNHGQENDGFDVNLDIDGDALANMSKSEAKAYLKDMGVPSSREEGRTGRKQKEEDYDDDFIEVYKDLKEAMRLVTTETESLTEANRGVIVEVHNCAVLLSEVSKMIGKEGPIALLLHDVKKDVVSAKPVNEPDMKIISNISEKIKGVSVGEKGKLITLEDIIEEFVAIENRSGQIKRMGSKIVFVKDDKDEFLEYHIRLLMIISELLGKEGPVWFEHGIVNNSNGDAELDPFRRSQSAPLPVPDEDSIGYGKVELKGELWRVPVGKKGKAVTIEDFVTVFFEVSTNPRLEAYRKSGRSYFHENFYVTGDDTLIMGWGS